MNGHVYVPTRFVAEHLGATIDYDAELHKIFVKNSDLDLSDPDYEGISVGNLIVAKAGTATKVTGQLIMAGVGSTHNMVEVSETLEPTQPSMPSRGTKDWKIRALSMIEVRQIYKIGEDGDKVFTLNPPGDVNYNPNDAELTATYLSMSKQINNIRTTFKLIN